MGRNVAIDVGVDTDHSRKRGVGMHRLLGVWVLRYRVIPVFFSDERRTAWCSTEWSRIYDHRSAMDNRK